jgi:hypothetical protein
VFDVASVSVTKLADTKSIGELDVELSTRDVGSRLRVFDVSSKSRIRVGFGAVCEVWLVAEGHTSMVKYVQDKIDLLQASPRGFDEEKVNSGENDEKIDASEDEIDPVRDVRKPNGGHLYDTKVEKLEERRWDVSRNREKS